MHHFVISVILVLGTGCAGTKNTATMQGGYR